MAPIDIRPFTPADRDWLVDAHGSLYAAEAGFDATFGPLVADILDTFIANHDPVDEAGWIAWEGTAPLGSIFCVRLDDTRAKLRLFLLLPEARGKGIGLRLLNTCMDFARKGGYSGMQLWTHESHRAACALYRRNGWQLTAQKPVHSFGQDLIEQTYEISF